MATLILSAVGTAFAGPLGGAIGALIGRQVDSLVFRPPAREGARLTELKITSSSYGLAIPRHFGRMRISGQIIWATDLIEHSDRQGGSKSSPGTVSYSYTASLAVALASRPIAGIGRVWADGRLLRGAAGDMKVGGTMRLHRGLANQAPDPLILAAEGAAQCSAYRGLAYAVFEDLELAEFGNRIPALTFEVLADNGTINLATITGALIEDCDADLPLDGIEGLSSEGALADTLQALDPFYGIDADACDERLVLRPERLQSAAIALPESATSSRREDFGGNAGYSRRRAEITQQPVRVLRYYDVDRDYQPGAQRAGGQPLAGQPRTIELPAALSAGSARRLVSFAARRGQWSRQTIAWRVTSHDPAVRPGARVTLPDHPGQWRVESWEWHDQGIDLSLVRLMDAPVPLQGADPGRASQLPDLAAVPTVLTALELPWDGLAATPVPLLLAATSASSAGWTGAGLFVDQGDGALQPLGSSGRARAVMGAAEDALPPANPLLFDRAGTVIVALVAADQLLVDATMRQLSMGANRALLGQEIIQFAQAQPLGGGRWRLSGLWRGRGGTEAAMASHAANEAFVLLDGQGTVLDPVAVGDTPEAEIAALGLGDTAPVVSPIRLRGIGWKPLTPVHPRVQLQAEGTRLLRWTRRARGGWGWSDGADLPLGEQTESYRVSFVSIANAELASWTVSQSELVVDQITLAALLAQAPSGRFHVRQIGDRALSDSLEFPAIS